MSDNAVSSADLPEPDQDLVPLTRGEAVELLAEQTGRSRDVAETMVRDYLDETSARLGYSVHRWGLDSGDVAEIRRDYEWVDYEQGETPADARARAAVNAAGWAQVTAEVDREHSPGYASRGDREALEWAERAEDWWSA
ncbi:hypothetical protein [Pseudonocardia sp. WMMC193]|uniref:hypothetical protein n=1 Tax=Pseudonocardia sp. WMMC193 TaxID=2911965 RepID=UPI001F44D12A|nr:hypothetical protein [Pseudonocardia sp. WMMC193]MCF7547423.1 hypothetical protein [Pseudonocardia sp. WMMC193]